MDADDHAARLNLASAQANVGEHAAALKGFKAIGATFGGDADYHVAFGQVHLALGDRDAALEQMVLALEAKPDCQPALDAMEKLGVLVAVYGTRATRFVTYVLPTRAGVPREQWTRTARRAFYLERLATTARAGSSGARRRGGPLARRRRQRASAPCCAGVCAARARRARRRCCRPRLRRREPALGPRAWTLPMPGRAGNADGPAAEVDASKQADPGDRPRWWPVSGREPPLVHVDAIIRRGAPSPRPTGRGRHWRSWARRLIVGRPEDALSISPAPARGTGRRRLRAEYWAELGKLQRYQDILADAARIAEIAKRDWKLRWNEAEAYAGLGKKVEARAAFSAINFDQGLHVDVRKRAKRAVKSLDEPTPG